MKIGLVINPLAGIGGTVALKGSDGEDVVTAALALGAKANAASRVESALAALTGADINVFTASAGMGEAVLVKAGFACTVVYTAGKNTTAADTQGAVKQLCEQGIDLLLFAGGDGTARDVMDTLQRAGRADTLPVVGIPAGCKIHSAVYAITPKRAGELVALLAGGSPMSLVAAQVMDLDESLFRQGEVKSRCYGYLQTPVDDTRMQLTKQGGVNNEAEALEEIAAEVVDTMEEGVLYIIGSGSTTQAIMQQLGLANTLLGVDVVFNHQLLENDVTEERLLTLLDSPDYAAVRIIVTVIGGQGFVFGRGNQQISAEVIRRVGVENITIVATSEKLRTLGQRGLLVDTGNEAMDNQLRGLRPVITGYEQKTLVTIG